MKNYNQLALEKWNEGERNKTVIAREVKQELGLSSNVEQLRKNISKYSDYHMRRWQKTHDSETLMYLPRLLFNPRNLRNLRINKLTRSIYSAPASVNRIHNAIYG